MVLVDLVDRARDLEAHYTDAGVLPRADLAELFDLGRWYWSAHLLTGSVAGQAVLFCAAAAAAVALGIGYRTRLATAASWLLLVSLQARNPMVLYGADQLLRMLLLWAIFLPLGACWSADRARVGDAAQGPVRHLSAASAAILLQMAAMYLFSGLLKQNPAWQSGEALSHIFSFEAYARPWAEIPLRHPDLLRPLTRAVPWLEIVPAILLFSPWATIRLRVIALCLLAAFHLTIESLLATGLFQVVCLTGLILFLPTSFWDRLTGGTEAVDTPRRVPPRVAGRVADVAAQVVVLLLLAYVLTWNVAGLRLEDYWARERLGWAREHLGRREGKGLPILSRDAIVERMLGSFGGIGRLASLHQRWDMFYRSGEFEGGWHELVGTLGDGRRISLLEGGIPFRGENHPKPISPLALYPGTRWRVYLTYLRSPGTQVARDRFAAVASRDWNQRHPALSIDRLEIRFVQDRHRSSAGPERQTTVWFDGPVR